MGSLWTFSSNLQTNKKKQDTLKSQKQKKEGGRRGIRKRKGRKVRRKKRRQKTQGWLTRWVEWRLWWFQSRVTAGMPVAYFCLRSRYWKHSQHCGSSEGGAHQSRVGGGVHQSSVGGGAHQSRVGVMFISHVLGWCLSVTCWVLTLDSVATMTFSPTSLFNANNQRNLGNNPFFSWEI